MDFVSSGLLGALQCKVIEFLVDGEEVALCVSPMRQNTAG